MLVLVLVTAFLIVGWEVCGWIFAPLSESALTAIERFAGAITLALVFWLGIDWLLLLTRTFSPLLLYMRTVVFVVAAVVIVVRRREQLRRSVTVSRPAGAFAMVLLLWSVFALWRGAVLPPVTHDVLSHHLPRAVMYERAGAFDDLSRLSPVFLDIPVNYEVLLADVLGMMHDDTYTEWVSTILYLFLVASAGALAQRWWRDAGTTLMTMICVAGIPVLLLHSSGHKNDVLVAVGMVLSLLWGGRYLSTGQFPALLLLGASVVIAAGTKPQGGILGAVLLPVVLFRMIADLRAARLTPRAVAAATLFIVVAVVLLGGWTYVDNFLPGQAAHALTAERSRVVQVTQGYGDWSNLWQAPWVLLAAPFSSNPYALWVPWDKPWFWKRYEIFFSHLGVLFSFFAVLSFFGFRRTADESNERVVLFSAAVVVFFLMLPVVFLPHGMYVISLPRYVLFFAAALMAWGAGVLMRLKVAARPRVRGAFFAGALLVFGAYGYDMAVHDTFAPLDYVLLARQYPGERYIPFDPNRSTSVVDRMAGPHDVIAIDAGWGGWVYPAFGAALSRDVRFIPETKTLQIPKDAQWVVVERAYQTIWGSAQMNTLGSAREQFGRGLKTADYRVARALIHDPNYQLVFANAMRNQFVFKRRTAAAPVR